MPDSSSNSEFQNSVCRYMVKLIKTPNRIFKYSIFNYAYHFTFLYASFNLVSASCCISYLNYSLHYFFLLISLSVNDYSKFVSIANAQIGTEWKFKYSVFQNIQYRVWDESTVSRDTLECNKFFNVCPVIMWHMGGNNSFSYRCLYLCYFFLILEIDP